MRGMMARLSVCAVAGLLLLAMDARSQDKITPDKLPAKVMDAVKARFPGAEFTAITKETADGKVVYDIELKQKGRKYEMDIQEDGTVLEVEKQVDLKDVPKAVLKIVEEK